MAERLYSEEQVAEIVRRAATIQESRAKEAYAPGVTHDELKRIAKEIGLSEDALEQALDEIRSNPVKYKAGWFGGVQLEEVIDGELRPEDFDVATEALPVNNQGAFLTQVGKSMRSTQMVGTHQVTTQITARDGRTRVKVRSTPVLPAILGGEAIIFGLIFGIMATVKNGPQIGIPILLGLTGLGSGFLYYGATKGKEKVVGYAEDLIRKISKVTVPGESPRDRLEETVINASPSEEAVQEDRI